MFAYKFPQAYRQDFFDKVLGNKGKYPNVFYFLI